MYDAMQAMPDAWRSTIARSRETVREFAAMISSSPRIFLVGLGTSLHAAQTGELILREYGADQDYRVVNTFDFCFYGPRLTPTDAVIVISQRGVNPPAGLVGYTALALKRAQESNAVTALVTGQNADLDAARTAARFVFADIPPEHSHAHTYSYVATAALLTLLAKELASRAHNPDQLSDTLLYEVMPQAIQTALNLESLIINLSNAFLASRRLFIIGAGPGAAVANEIGLKIKETSYLQAEGIATEPFLHGNFQCAEAEDGFILVAPAGAAHTRTLTIAAMARDLGARCAVVSDLPAPAEWEQAHWIQVPRVPEPLSAVTCMVPLFLFAYHLARLRGINPDHFRLDDPRFARAMERTRL